MHHLKHHTTIIDKPSFVILPQICSSSPRAHLQIELLSSTRTVGNVHSAVCWQTLPISPLLPRCHSKPTLSVSSKQVKCLRSLTSGIVLSASLNYAVLSVRHFSIRSGTCMSHHCVNDCFKLLWLEGHLCRQMVDCIQPTDLVLEISPINIIWTCSCSIHTACPKEIMCTVMNNI